jgi:hypothetical protein
VTTWNESREILRAARAKAIAACAILETMGASPADAKELLSDAWRLVAQIGSALPADVPRPPRWALGLPWNRRARSTDLAAAAASHLSRLTGDKALPRRSMRSESVEVSRAISSCHVRCVAAFAPPWRRRTWALGQILCGLGLIAAALGAAFAAREFAVQPGLSEGLTAFYWKALTEKGQSMERIDHRIDFDWGLGAPFKKFPKDNFSARWEGCVVVGPGDRALLEAGADDAIRVVVKGKTIIDDWGTHAYRVRKAAKALPAGMHPIRVTYQDRKGPARVYLGWSLNGRPGVAIPPESLLPRTIAAQSGAADTACPKMPGAKK